LEDRGQGIQLGEGVINTGKQGNTAGIRMDCLGKFSVNCVGKEIIIPARTVGKRERI